MISSAADPTYHVIQDVKHDGKSTEIIENLGHTSEICSKYNVYDADIWANKYIKFRFYHSFQKFRHLRSDGTCLLYTSPSPRDCS